MLVTAEKPATQTSPETHDDAERRFRGILSSYMDVKERAVYSQRSAIRSLATFAHIWIALIVSFLVVVQLQRVALAIQLAAAPVVILFIGSRINALAVQVHEGSHGLLMTSRRRNNWFCNIGAAWWVLNDVESYWKLHSVHHTQLLEECDPDRDLYSLPPTRSRIVLLLIQDLLWITAARRIFKYVASGSKKTRSTSTDNSKLGNMAGKLTAQLSIIALFAWQFGILHGAVLWFTYWTIPLFSVFPLLIRLRIATEHYSESMHSPTPFGFVSRTSTSFAIEEYLIGAQMEYHMEHHLFPNIPYFQLKKLHRRLEELGAFDAMSDDKRYVLSGGYFQFWKTLLTEKRTAL